MDAAGELKTLQPPALPGEPSAGTPLRPRHIVAVVDWNEGYRRGVLRGIRNFVRGQPDWILHSLPTPTPIQTIMQRQPAGAIVLPHIHDHCAAIFRRGVPLVSVLSRLGRLWPVVTFDEHLVGAAAARSFLDHGFEHFAVVTIAAPWGRPRVAGFSRTLAATGRQPAIYRIPLPVERRRGRTGIVPYDHRVQRWLENLPKPVGIFAMNDIWGRETAEMCRQAGLSVPEQVAIIGVDNDEFICQMTQPELSSVAIPWEKIGFEAAACLDRLLRGQAAPPSPILIPPAEVITRHSSDVVAVDDPWLAQALQFIHQHAREPINVHDVLRAVPIERRKFERQCRRVLGRSPLREIRRVRMEHARRLLAETDLPMHRVAECCGISEKEFAGAFRKETGTTPLRWRRQVRARVAV